MGLGGILAAMAQGFGTGVIKNVEQGWKEDETNKMLDWKEKESDKQRAFESEQLDKKHQHDFELEDHKTRNAISETVAKYQAAARYARSTGSGGSSNGIKETQRDLTGKMQTIGIYEAQIGTLTERLSQTEDKDQREALINRINALDNAKNDFLKKESTRQSFANAGDMGAALYMTSGGDMDLYNPKPKEPQRAVIEEVKPQISAPARNMVDVNSISPQQAAQIAREKREEVARQNFARASEEAKEWAAKQNQYKSTMFTPRTF